MLFTPTNSVNFAGVQVMDEGIQEQFGRDGSRIPWTLLCLWSERVTLLQSLLGGAVVNNGQITVFAPFRHPDYPWMAVTNVNVVGVPGQNGYTIGPSGMIAYDYARLEIEFTTLDPQDLGEERVDYSARIITVPNGTFGFGSGTSRAVLMSAESPPLVLPRVTLQRTFNSQPSIPSSLIFSMLGRVNNATFLGAGTAQVLFMGACSQRTFSSRGQKLWSITYSFCCDPSGWNNYLNPKTGQFEALTKADGSPPYTLGNFTQFRITE